MGRFSINAAVYGAAGVRSQTGLTSLRLKTSSGRRAQDFRVLARAAADRLESDRVQSPPRAGRRINRAVMYVLPTPVSVPVTNAFTGGREPLASYCTVDDHCLERRLVAPGAWCRAEAPA